MARDPIIQASNVRLQTTFPPAVTNLSPPAPSNAGALTVIRFGFGPRETPVVKMNGSVQAGLFAADDRKQCGLEFMQFATPSRFVREYVGLLAGSTTFDFSGSLRNREFLDTPTVDTGALLVPVRGVFMSRTAHRANETRDGHFINSMEDHPGIGTPDFVVAENNERHFLFRVSYLTTFATLLVFLHPSGRRQPLALVRWTTSYDFSMRWRGGRIASIVGVGKVTAGTSVTAPDALVDFVPRVNNPPRFVINQVMNPKLMTGLANPLPDADQRFFFPLPHPAVGGDFWAL